MSIKTKSFVVGDTTYQVKQHPATEGCALLQSYSNAINSFVGVVNQRVYQVQNKHLIPFTINVDGHWLALTMFIDKLAAPESAYQRSTDVPPPSQYLTVKEIKAGLTMADRKLVEPVYEPIPLGDVVRYTATDSQMQSVDVDAEFARFFEYTTVDGVQVDIDSLSFTDLSELLAKILVFNFLTIWDKPRFNLPENFNPGYDITLGVQRAKKQYSQPNVIYTIMQSKLALADYAALSTTVSTEEAFNMYEAATLAYYEEVEANKEAQRQSKNN